MGGRGSSSGMGGAMNGSSPSTIAAIQSLKKGSIIQIEYNGHTDQFKLRSKYYPFLQATATVWVNTSKNGYMNDFAPNKTTLEMTLKNTKIKIIEKK